MKLKFEVLGCGSFEGKTRDNKSFMRLRMMGFVYDCNGDKVPATCDMGYDAKMDDDPKTGDVVIVDINSFDMRNAMASMTFLKLDHVASQGQGRELKR